MITGGTFRTTPHCHPLLRRLHPYRPRLSEAWVYLTPSPQVTGDWASAGPTWSKISHLDFLSPPLGSGLPRCGTGRVYKSSGAMGRLSSTCNPKRTNEGTSIKQGGRGTERQKYSRPGSTGVQERLLSPLNFVLSFLHCFLLNV